MWNGLFRERKVPQQFPTNRVPLVGAIGLEPTTPTMSRWCSNQLSYAPAKPRIIAVSHCWELPELTFDELSELPECGPPIQARGTDAQRPPLRW
jgi:hypothetical protein